MDIGSQLVKVTGRRLLGRHRSGYYNPYSRNRRQSGKMNSFGPCEYGNEPSDFITHGYTLVSQLVKDTGKRPLGRHMRNWEDNIIIDVKEIDDNLKI